MPNEPHNSRRILVVDDEPVISCTLAEILVRQGFDAMSFTGAADALASAREAAPDLLLSDVVMPRVSGVDLAIEIRNCYPECKILLLSGQAVTADLLRQARAKGYDFEMLLKPVHPTDLLKRIHSLLGNGPPSADSGKEPGERPRR